MYPEPPPLKQGIVGKDDPTARIANVSLYLHEPYSISPHTYNPSVWQWYDTIYTWNSKIYYQFFNRFRMRLTGIQGMVKNTFTGHVPFSSKLGVCTICKMYKTEKEFNIVHMKQDYLNYISGKVKNCGAFGAVKYCHDDVYKGEIKNEDGTLKPSSNEKLRVLARYKYCLAFESCMHDYWALDWITEKIYDCFLAKCMPIFLGAPNIKEKIPKELYISMRDYVGLDELIYTLDNMSELEYNTTTEMAYQYYHDVFDPRVPELDA
uniref:Putative glycosyltransferase n=1 Tax=viral metagenome TaxID=1070528 RepID=A0A6M3MGB8_9ZZZZ